MLLGLGARDASAGLGRYQAGAGAGPACQGTAGATAAAATRPATAAGQHSRHQKGSIATTSRSPPPSFSASLNILEICVSAIPICIANTNCASEGRLTGAAPRVCG
eukprot:3650243-Rhodomonas_salina.12